jgi:hypothetical protein
MITDHVEFSSSHFSVEAGEDDETNPGIYGRALAAWLATQLRGRGVTVEDIVAEDFGRCVIVRRSPFRLWIACASEDGSRTRWQMFIALEQGLLSRLFRRQDAQAELARLRLHFRAIVADVPGATDVTWQDAERGAHQ